MDDVQKVEGANKSSLEKWINAILNEDAENLSIGSVRTLQMLKQEFERLQKENAELLSKLKPVEKVSDAEIGNMASEKYPVNIWYVTDKNTGKQKSIGDENEDFREGYIAGAKAIREILNNKESIFKDFKEVTGHNTPAELRAYEKGREDEASVYIDFIRKYEGNTNSVFGQAMKDTFDRLNNKESNAVEFYKWLRKNYNSDMAKEGISIEKLYEVFKLAPKQ